MASKHIVEELIEANKKISQTINKMENNQSSNTDRQTWIDDLNGIIRQLDHIVEDLEKHDKP
jgi:polyhydroxyalkanoate synthesis regulator phasin